MKTLNQSNVIESLVNKYSLKLDVYQNTCLAFDYLRAATSELVAKNSKKVGKISTSIPFEFNDKGEFQFELRFGSDVLLFMKHTNVFEFDRGHEVKKTNYLKEDPLRSYCGSIQIFNFLADSFKYNRINDLGYLIARVFINKEMHYFIEGKREVGLLYNNFEKAKMNMNAAHSIIESAMMYCINFDLLNPPFDDIKEVSVMEMQETMQNMTLKTGKRLGFMFRADKQ